MLSAEAAIRKNLRLGLFGVLAFIVAAFYWSVMAQLDSAVVTQGTVIVESSIKKVQHPTGGVIGAINVREGQRVTEGDVVVRLDDTATRAALGIIVNELTTTRVRVARLNTERAGAATIAFPEDLITRSTKESDVRLTLDGENRVFASRRVLRNGQKAQLGQRVGQLEEEVKGLIGQERSLEIQLKVARQELLDLRELEAKKLTIKPRLTNLEREIARNEGQLGETMARRLSLKGKIAETQLQILQLDDDHIAEISKELREGESKINELQERRITAEDQLKRVEVRAPISGIIHQLAVHTVGGVVNQTEALMSIVPELDRLVLEVRIQPQDIDQVHVGQSARVRFTAFNQRTTPEITGELYRIGGDLTKEPQTGTAFFTAGIAIGEGELRKLDGLRLMPGMPADAFIKTGARTFASYIVKPLTDHMSRSMRER